MMMNARTFAQILTAAACLLVAAPKGVSAQTTIQVGTASFVLEEVEPGVFGFPSGDDQGVPGRFVRLTGTIEGLNFEPGFCNPGVDNSLGFSTSCLLFGDGPGQFTRVRRGGTAFTTCYCTVDGMGDQDDSFVLKISYPPATPPQYPGGFTKFTIQNGTGALEGLRGQGTLDFASDPQITFNYHFVGK